VRFPWLRWLTVNRQEVEGVGFEERLESFAAIRHQVDDR
jgi:hypothetical protein